MRKKKFIAILQIICLLIVGCSLNQFPRILDSALPSEERFEKTASPSISPTNIPPTYEAWDFSGIQKTFRFAVIGDYGTNDQGERMVANLVKSFSPDLIITVGDNNYPRGDAATIDNNIGQYFHDFIFPYEGSFGDSSEYNRFFPTLGNHDYKTNGAKPYLDFFQLPGNERYYEFVWGPVHFFAINSERKEPDGIEEYSIQANWLKNSLESSTSAWKIVYMHRSPFTSGNHESDDVLQWPFAKWGVTAVLSGHSHTYERLDVNGIPYIVNGLGGRGIGGFNHILPNSIVQYNEGHGAMIVEADRRKIEFSFYSLEESSPKLIDRFVLTK